MTNYEKIKQMTVDEMAVELKKFISDDDYCYSCRFYNYKDSPCQRSITLTCLDAVKYWLESEVEK